MTRVLIEKSPTEGFMVYVINEGRPFIVIYAPELNISPEALEAYLSELPIMQEQEQAQETEGSDE